MLWEADIVEVENIEEGHTYLILKEGYTKSLRMKENRLTGDLYLNPAKDVSAISVANEFPPYSLTPPQSIPADLVTSSISGEIIGINICLVYWTS